MSRTLAINEPFSCYSHMIGALASLVGTFVLIMIASKSAPLLIVCTIYGLSVVFLFTTSAIYHACKIEENSGSFLRRLDHLAIFFMIAGTYTPVSYCFFSQAWFTGIMIAQWSIVVLGFFIIIFFINAPRLLSTGLYLAMGWMAFFVMYKIINTFPLITLVYLFAGAAAYSIGAIIYYLKKPDPLPGKFGFHEIFHIFILIGGAMHFMMVLTTIQEY